jgi:hypothetical protein
MIYQHAITVEREEKMNELEEESRTGLCTAIIAKCLNPDCDWEVRADEKVRSDDAGNISCPMCGRHMEWGVN